MNLLVRAGFEISIHSQYTRRPSLGRRGGRYTLSDPRRTIVDVHQTARLRFDRHKHRPDDWRSPRCVVHQCERGARSGGLCPPCTERVAAEVALDLGFAPEGVRVDRAAGYVHYRRGGLWYAVHRAVMERELGRPLGRGENVHHRNGNRADNSPSNLELWVVAQPAGQRPEDLVAHARTILGRYGDEVERAKYA